MKSKKVKSAFIECNEISSDIMNRVSSHLTSEGVEHTRKNESEIIINNKSKDEIKDLVKNISGITKQQIKLILQISEINDKIFIRQKFS